MRKSIKKIVASVVAGAMALAMMVTPNVAEAASGAMTLHVICEDDTSSYTGTALQVWGGLSQEGTVAMNTLSSAWGETNETAVKVITLTDGKVDLQVTYDGAGESGMQFIKYTASTADCAQVAHADAALMAALNSDATELWITFKGSNATLSTTDPSLKSAVELCVEAIDAIGEVTLGSADKIAAAEEAYAALSEEEKANVTNYATLTAAREAYDALKKAEDEKNAAAAGELTLYVKAPEGWNTVSLWAWTSNGNLFKDWPGQAMTACENNAGYWKATISVDGVTSVIFNDSAENNKQTVDIVDLAAGTYWFVELTENAEGKFEGTPSTTAPEGWADEVKAEIETEPTTEGSEDEGTAEGEEEETEAPDASAWEDALLKIHFLNSLEWEKVGVYLTYGSWAQLTGAWPGSEMQLEDGSETWYAVCTNADAEETYNVIFNNMVSDEEADAGTGVKHQTTNVEGIAAGEYWFVLGDVDSEKEDGTQVTYGFTMFDSVEALEEAGYTYDGNGLVGDVVVDDPNEDDEDEEETEAEETTEAEDEKADGETETGDAAPIAVVFLGMFAAVAVVASKKRQNA